MSATSGLCSRAPSEREPTFGLVCVSPRRFPRKATELGRLVTALDALLRDCPQDDAAVAAGGEIWLDDPPASETGPA